MFINRGKTNWAVLVLVAMAAGAAGGMLSTYINNSIRQEIALTESATFDVPVKKVSATPAKKCGMGAEDRDPSACDTACAVDSDCRFSCGCGAISKNETCDTDGVIFDCVNRRVFCQGGKCAYGEEQVPVPD
jgi:hypothetical protein